MNTLSPTAEADIDRVLYAFMAPGKRSTVEILTSLERQCPHLFDEDMAAFIPEVLRSIAHKMLDHADELDRLYLIPCSCEQRH